MLSKLNVSAEHQVRAEIGSDGRLTDNDSIKFIINNIFSAAELHRHIKKEKTLSDFQELATDPYLLELFSEKKILSIVELGQTQNYGFVTSKIFPTQNNSAPIVVDFYQCEGETICILRLGEYYAPVILVTPARNRVFTYLDASEKSKKWFQRIVGSLPSLLQHCESEIEKGIFLYSGKATGINLQRSPGHYIEDELPFAYKLSKYLAGTSNLEVFYTPGLGFELDERLASRVAYFATRQRLFDHFNNGSYWFIPNVTRNIGYEDSTLEFIELSGRKVFSSSTNTIRNKQTKFFAFGHRFIPRDGKTFIFSAHDLRQLCIALAEIDHACTGIKYSYVPVLDFDLFDCDDEIDPFSVQYGFLAEVIKIFDQAIPNTLNLPLRKKIEVLRMCDFGVYPHGSGLGVFYTFLNSKTLLVHNYRSEGLMSISDYIKDQFKVLENPYIQFNKNSAHILTESVCGTDLTWTLDLNNAAKEIYSILNERPAEDRS